MNIKKKDARYSKPLDITILKCVKATGYTTVEEYLSNFDSITQQSLSNLKRNNPSKYNVTLLGTLVLNSNIDEERLLYLMEQLRLDRESKKTLSVNGLL